ncbi:Maf family protein [Rheinheimera soli]|uniref:dTTP/UTP pyrophosphatase n=1 Tax=Rheinheimera soli TaxID=443616 RepID=A0ABU1W2A9_9GAMM|nr:Maf family protein [Rheinheimera soli]MDR7122111.1 septum formation protein [Rheinheimera soli]
MIALASASPRRRELLVQLQQDFVLVKGEIDESQLEGETADQYVLRLAEQKALAGYQSQQRPLPTLGADTIVQVDELVLGKPVDLVDFQRMMGLLSGRSHWVKTAVAIATAQGMISTTVATKVWFKPLSEQEILWYWTTGEPADKAGGYGIQGLAGQFVQRIDGSYFAVVGLPLYETAQLLQTLKDMQ